MAHRLLGCRIFAVADGKMNRSLADSGGGLLLVSQFTLAANTQKGMRPSLTTAASPELGKQRFDVMNWLLCAEVVMQSLPPVVSAHTYTSIWSTMGR